MRRTPGDLLAWGRTTTGRRKLRYVAASVYSAIVGQVALLVAFGGLRWSAGAAAVFSFAVAAVASYHLNRIWVWERAGRSDLLREVVPFWIVAAVSLALTTAVIVGAEHLASRMTEVHWIRTAAVMGAAIASVFPVWLVKYLVLDRYVFTWSRLTGERPQLSEPV